jgi:NAD(P)-dependent dehydrogenase (short-subunit alcohol dehydrogenase family)
MTDDLFSVRGQHVLVTGGSRGIGRAIADGFANRGARVMICSKSPESVETALREMKDAGLSAEGVACDVADPDQITATVRHAIATMGHVDTLVNAAGMNRRKPTTEVTLDDYDAILNANLRGAFLMSQEIGRHMIERKSGVQINIESLNTWMPLKAVLPYAMSKYGMQGMTKGLAMEWGPHGVRVNSLAPGFVLVRSRHAGMESGQCAARTAWPAGRHGRNGHLSCVQGFRLHDRANALCGRRILFRLELAEAYRKVAQVQSNPGTPNLGQPKEALQSLAKAEKILATLKKEKPLVAVIDSIQTLYSEALQSAPGSVAQVRECAAQLTRLAKQSGVCVILVGHVTKEGALAGPRVLEHIVDTVLYFEGDTHSSFRLIRAFKNRFGAVNELGVFAMTDKGLRGVSNPSALFLSQHAQEVSGSCVLVTQEGTRPLLVEIQALVDAAHSPSPRRLTVGLDAQRLAMLLAVLHRHAGIVCFDQDVFVNAVGGVRIQEPAADLAVLLAIVSSLNNRPLPAKLEEAAKLGFTHALVPKANAPKQAVKGIEVIALERIEQAIDAMRSLR